MDKSNEIKLALAPMAGVTDRAFREICLDWGTDITWSEMVSAEGIVRNPIKNNKSLLLAKPAKKERGGEFWVQIFGSNPDSMARAAAIVEKEIKPHGIDINLGCPVPKAMKSGYGVFQLKNIEQTVEMIKKIKQSIILPLSAKTRLGFEDKKEILTFAPKLEKAGLDQLVVHARTYKEMFRSNPHWEIVKKLKNKIRIPIIYNGGIDSPQKALFYSQQTGCKTLMLGQATVGNPWLFRQIKEFLKGELNWKPSKKEIGETILSHAKLTFDYYGNHGIVCFRRHLMAYLKKSAAASRLRSKVVSIKSLKEIEIILAQSDFRS